MPSPGMLARGRPDADTQRWRARMQQLLKQVTTDDDVLDVWEHVTEMAKESQDIQWAALFLAYTLGKPVAADESHAGLTVGGDLNIAISQLSREQLRALASIDATITTLAAEQPPELSSPSAD